MTFKYNKVFKEGNTQILKAVINGDKFPILIRNQKGSRGSGKTGNEIRLSINIGLLKRTKIYAFRYIASDLPDTLISDFLNIFEMMKIKYEYKVGNKEIHFGKDSIVKFFGLKKSKSDKINLTGLSSEEYRFEYGIILKDEITEYEKSESNAIDEAIRGFKRDHVLEIRTWNPVNPLAWANEHFLKYLPENEERMKKIGIDQKIIFTEDNQKTEQFIQTNFSVNNFCDYNLRRNLEQLKVHDPFRARTMSWGLDGIDEMNLFGQPVFRAINDAGVRQLWADDRQNNKFGDVGRWVVGMDYGRIDASVMNLIWVRPNYGAILVDTFHHWRQKDRLVEDGVLIKIMAAKLREWKSKYDLPFRVEVGFDPSAPTFFETLKNEMIGSNYNFNYVDKSELHNRMDFIKKLGEEQKIYLNVSNTNTRRLENEMKFAIAKFNLNHEIKEITTKCDTIDAFSYGLEKVSYWVLNSIFYKNEDKTDSIYI